jgi:hypothetical protein
VDESLAQIWFCGINNYDAVYFYSYLAPILRDFFASTGSIYPAGPVFPAAIFCFYLVVLGAVVDNPSATSLV